MIRNKLIAIFAVTTMAAMIQTAQAAFTDTLADLVANNGSLSVGDKTFSGFSYLATDLTGFNASKIIVTASQVGDNYFLTWGGKITLGSLGPASADLLLGYTVTAQPGKIVAIDQNYTGSAQNSVGLSAGTFLAVDENVYVPGSAVAIGHSHLSAFDLSDPFAEPGDILTIKPAQHILNVTKDIGFDIADPNGGFITISQIEQSFDQVPEPTTMIAGALLLLPFGASTLRILRRNRMV
jgi:hypothetical protein